MMQSGESRAIDICNAIGKCMERNNLTPDEQIEVLGFLIRKLQGVQVQMQLRQGPSDEQLLDDKEAEDDE